MYYIRNKMKNQLCHTVETIPNSNRKIVTRGKIDTTNTHMHDPTTHTHMHDPTRFPGLT